MVKCIHHDVKGSTTILRQVYNINQFEKIHNTIYFSVYEEACVNQMVASGQVIVDSDACAFIYIVEEDGAYNYLSFPQEVWPALVEIVLTKEDPYLVQDKKLVQFAEELDYLLWNIQGNDNYGQQFVEAVEKQFAQFYDL